MDVPRNDSALASATATRKNLPTSNASSVVNNNSSKENTTAVVTKQPTPHVPPPPNGKEADEAEPLTCVNRIHEEARALAVGLFTAANNGTIAPTGTATTKATKPSGSSHTDKKSNTVSDAGKSAEDTTEKQTSAKAAGSSVVQKGHTTQLNNSTVSNGTTKQVEVQVLQNKLVSTPGKSSVDKTAASATVTSVRKPVQTMHQTNSSAPSGKIVYQVSTVATLQKKNATHTSIAVTKASQVPKPVQTMQQRNPTTAKPLQKTNVTKQIKPNITQNNNKQSNKTQKVQSKAKTNNNQKTDSTTPRRSSRSRTPTKPTEYEPSENDVLMMKKEKDKNYPSIKVGPDQKDATHFSIHQLNWMRDNDNPNFSLLDFVHCSNKMIRKLFLKEDNPLMKSKIKFPLNARRNVWEIKRFIRLSNSKCRTQIKKIESDSDSFLLKHLQDEGDADRRFRCLGLSKSVLLQTAGTSMNDDYLDNLILGYQFYCQQSILNLADDLGMSSKIHDDRLFGKSGFIPVSETDPKKGRFFLCMTENRGFLKTHDKFDQYCFHHETCSNFFEPGKKQANIGVIEDNAIICSSCKSVLKGFRKKCSGKGSLERAKKRKLNGEDLKEKKKLKQPDATSSSTTTPRENIASTSNENQNQNQIEEDPSEDELLRRKRLHEQARAFALGHFTVVNRESATAVTVATDATGPSVTI